MGSYQLTFSTNFCHNCPQFLCLKDNSSLLQLGSYLTIISIGDSNIVQSKFGNVSTLKKKKSETGHETNLVVNKFPG